MSFHRPIVEYDALETAAFVVVTLARLDRPRPADAIKAVELLARVMAEQLGNAPRLPAELDQLRHDWNGFVARWSADRIAAEWSSFTTEAVHMLERIRERATFDTMIRYSLTVEAHTSGRDRTN